VAAVGGGVGVALVALVAERRKRFRQLQMRSPYAQRCRSLPQRHLRCACRHGDFKAKPQIQDGKPKY
jgi:hypothetical protein